MRSLHNVCVSTTQLWVAATLPLLLRSWDPWLRRTSRPQCGYRLTSLNKRTNGIGDLTRHRVSWGSPLMVPIFKLLPYRKKDIAWTETTMITKKQDCLGAWNFSHNVLQNNQLLRQTVSASRKSRWCPRWAACSFPLRQSPHDFFLQEICTSVSPNRSSRCVYSLKPEQ